MKNFCVVSKSGKEEVKNGKKSEKTEDTMSKKNYPLIFKEMPGTKIKKKNSVKPQAL